MQGSGVREQGSRTGIRERGKAGRLTAEWLTGNGCTLPTPGVYIGTKPGGKWAYRGTNGGSGAGSPKTSFCKGTLMRQMYPFEGAISLK
jgi:hypothetical protein